MPETETTFPETKEGFALVATIRKAGLALYRKGEVYKILDGNKFTEEANGERGYPPAPKGKWNWVPGGHPWGQTKKNLSGGFVPGPRPKAAKQAAPKKAAPTAPKKATAKKAASLKKSAPKKAAPKKSRAKARSGAKAASAAKKRTSRAA